MKSTTEYLNNPDTATPEWLLKASKTKQTMNTEEMLWDIYIEMGSKQHIRDNYYSYEPVYIGDVLDYWDTIAYLYPERTEYTILYKWGNKRLAIDDQSDECIEYVYSLIKE